MIPPERWKHVIGSDNPADCASRGLFPSELIDHHLWWYGPNWVKSMELPKQPSLSSEWSCPESTVEVCHIATTLPAKPSLVVHVDRYSSFERIRRIVAWILRFINNCRPQKFKRSPTNYLTTSELCLAEVHLFSVVQADQFSFEISLLKLNHSVPKGNCLLPLSPFVDSFGLIRVGGRQSLAHLSFSRKHPIILHGGHPMVKLLIPLNTDVYCMLGQLS